MAFRNIIIDSRCKLDYSLNYLICKKENTITKVLLDEIKLIVISTTQVSITTSLICMLTEKKIKVIFCDEKKNPNCELVPYQNNFYSYRKIKEQIKFTTEGRNNFWRLIVVQKIKNQAENLKIVNKSKECELLYSYMNEVNDGDTSNREGHSAKVYFNALFGTSFNRKIDNSINRYLNYGYSILASCINREIKSYGYLTELGIHHIGESNPFNLSYDLIEPLRPLIDSYVIKELIHEDNYKTELVNVLQTKVNYNNKELILDNAIHLYITDMLTCLKNNDITNVKFIEYSV